MGPHHPRCPKPRNENSDKDIYSLARLAGEHWHLIWCGYTRPSALLLIHYGAEAEIFPKRVFPRNFITAKWAGTLRRIFSELRQDVGSLKIWMSQNSRGVCPIGCQLKIRDLRSCLRSCGGIGSPLRHCSETGLDKYYGFRGGSNWNRRLVVIDW
jgi:hypothetical protein